MTVRQELEALASANLQTPLLRSLEAHLRECDSCRALVGRSRALVDVLTSLPRKSAPVDFLDQVWDRVLAEDGRSGFTSRLTEEMGSLPRVEAPEVEVEDPRLAGLLGSLPPVTAPPALDRAVRSSLRDYLWSSSRPARIFRLVAGGLAAAASLLLCLTLWTGSDAGAPSRPRFVYRDVSAPLAGWSSHEAELTGSVLPREDDLQGERPGGGR